MKFAPSLLPLNHCEVHHQHAKLLNLLSEYGEISTTEASKIKEFFRPLKAKKRQILVHEGELCTKMYFVNAGMVRAYFKNKSGQETTRLISTENFFIVNIDSFRNLHKNNETIECIEDAELLMLSRVHFVTLMDDFPNLKNVYTRILETYNNFNVKRFQMMSMENIQSKIEFFKEECPHLHGRLADSILASYLGVSRETLVRNKKFLY